MPSSSGSPEPRVSEELLNQLAEAAEGEVINSFSDLNMKERLAIADGEPYCFRCGKPASSFAEYDYQYAGGDRADYVRDQEGTYNQDINRFACDGCYIAIGTPSAPGGWRAP